MRRKEVAGEGAGRQEESPMESPAKADPSKVAGGKQDKEKLSNSLAGDVKLEG